MPETKNAKSPLASKTIWFNALAALTWIVDTVHPFVPSDYERWFILAVIVVNAILRFVTGKPLEMPKPGKLTGWGVPFMIAMIAIMPGLSQAQDANVRSAVVYDLAERETVMTVGYKIKEFPDFLVKGLSAEAWALGGYGTSTGIGSLGFGLVAPYRLARNLTIYAGGSFRASTQRTPTVGIIVGFRIDID